MSSESPCCARASTVTPEDSFHSSFTSIYAFVRARRAAAQLPIFSALNIMDDEDTRDSRKVCQTECLRVLREAYKVTISLLPPSLHRSKR